MKRYAFIDVHNTDSTTQQMLGFVVDWTKLIDYLKYKKSCSEIIFYTGIDIGDEETAKEFDELAKIGTCIVKSKPIFSYKNKDKTLGVKCVNCGTENVYTINTGYNKKANCDVELSVDVIEKSASEVELFIFTGDGDFEYLIRKALEKGVDRVYICSYAGKKIRAGITVSRFSTKLKGLIAEKSDKVFYVSLKDIKEKIKKTLPTV